MSQTVLVIDSNSAVQAITTLALNQSDCMVETLADGAQAYQRIRALKPTVVLCAKELSGVDPFELCKRVKSESRATAFVLLAPADAVQVTSRMAQEAQFDEVIYKPFKSNRLREIVTALMQRNASESVSAPIFLVGLQDGLRKKILERFLGKHGCQVLAEFKPEMAASTLAVLDSGAKAPKGVERENVFTVSADDKGERTNHIMLPLTAEGIKKVLGGYLEFKPELGPSPTRAINEPASLPTEQSEIAAEISAQVFRTLLTSPAVSRKSLKETAQIVQEELKRLAHKLGWDD